VPALKEALHAFMTVDLSTAQAHRWLWLAHSAAADVWDEETWAALPARQLNLNPPTDLVFCGCRNEESAL